MKNTFDPKDTLSYIVESDPNLAFILYRHGIQLSEPEKTFRTACEEKDIDPEFFIHVVNIYHDKETFNPQALSDFSFETIIDFLLNTHQYFIYKRLQEIEQSINHVILENGDNILIEILKSFYLNQKGLLIEHINMEEEKLFPQILKLETAEAITDENYEKIIHFFEKHDDHPENELYKLQATLLESYDKNEQGPAFGLLINRLTQFETDLRVHALIENEVLLPKCKSIKQLST